MNTSIYLKKNFETLKLTDSILISILIPSVSAQVSYIKDGAMAATRWVNFFAFLWFTQFLLGCQDFIIAGSVSKWFFTRNKTKLGWPIAVSFGHLIRYHLGSVCFGSLLIAVTQLVRAVFRLFQVKS